MSMRDAQLEAQEVSFQMYIASCVVCSLKAAGCAILHHSYQATWSMFDSSRACLQ